jgi:hypothetical protein
MLSTAALAVGLLRVDAFAVVDVGLSTLAVAFFAGLLALGAYLSLRTIV